MTMDTQRALLVLRKAGAGLTLAGLMAIGTISPATADVTPQRTDVFRHFSDCLHALLTNGAEHAASCTPSIVPTSTQSLSSGGGGNSCDRQQQSMILATPLAKGEIILVAVACVPPEEQ